MSSLQVLKSIEKSLQNQESLMKRQEEIMRKQVIANKKVLNPEECAIHLETTVGAIYQLVNKRQIPYSKPTGGKLYFDRVKVEEWQLSRPAATESDIEDKANAYLRKNKRKI